MEYSLQLDAMGLTDVGRVREHNEDSITVDTKNNLFAIADGMGGHMSGDVASQTTLEELQRQIKLQLNNGCDLSNQEHCYNMIVDSVTECNARILKKNHENGSGLGTGMGTTLTGVYFLADISSVIVFNVGDSRVYRLRKRAFEQLTRDHSMYQEWCDSGQHGQAPSRNILSKAIGLMETALPDVTLKGVQPKDVYLICSDGLSNLIDDESIQDYLIGSEHLSSHSKCEALVNIANDNGGYDNISVVIVKVNDHPSSVSNAEDITVQRQRD